MNTNEIPKRDRQPFWHQRVVRLLRFNRYTLFAGIVWRPTTGDRGDTWFQAWLKYRLDVKTAWQIACGIYA